MHFVDDRISNVVKRAFVDFQNCRRVFCKAKSKKKKKKQINKKKQQLLAGHFATSHYLPFNAEKVVVMLSLDPYRI